MRTRAGGQIPSGRRPVITIPLAEFNEVTNNQIIFLTNLIVGAQQRFLTISNTFSKDFK